VSNSKPGPKSPTKSCGAITMMIEPEAVVRLVQRCPLGLREIRLIRPRLFPIPFHPNYFGKLSGVSGVSGQEE
jgi:hypothetical protein